MSEASVIIDGARSPLLGPGRFRPVVHRKWKAPRGGAGLI